MYYTMKDKNFKTIKVEYEITLETKIDFQNMIQKLADLQESLYMESIDCVDASYELGKIIDDIIDIKMDN